MTTLSEQTVRTGAAPASKAEAIGLAAGLLAGAGHIDPAYEQSMLGREKVANTYLGEGIAIPHGMLKDRELIRTTGLAVVQVPGGVEWNPGETVRLVVGIAAASDEHLAILANLTRILADATLVELAHGLHARPATEFVALAGGFASDVRVRHGGRVANGKSLASLLAIGAGSGAALTLAALGDDAEDALAALKAVDEVVAATATA